MTTLPHLSLIATLAVCLSSGTAFAERMLDSHEGGEGSGAAIEGAKAEKAHDHGSRFAFGAFVGAAAPSDTFGVASEEASLDQGFLVGLRAAHRIARRFEVELEGSVGGAAVRDSDEDATIVTGRVQLRGLLSPGADASLFAVLGLGGMAALNAEPLVDETARATAHYGVGVSMAMNKSVHARLEGRHVLGRGSDDGLSSMAELHLGFGIAF